MLLPEFDDPPFTDEDLEAYLAFEYEYEASNFVTPDDERQSRERVAAWSVCDTGSAEFAMRKLAHAEAVIADRDAAAAEFHRQIDRWLAGEVRPHQRSVNFFTGQLESYARRRREEQGEKTLTLPSGQVTSRMNPARPKIEDEDAFIEWAKRSQPALVKAKWSPVMAAVKAALEWALTDNGVVPVFGDVVVPGVVQVPAEVTYTVKVERP